MTQADPVLSYATIVARPGVVTWYKVYCIGMAVMYAVLAVVGAWMLATDPFEGDDDGLGVVLTVVSLPLAIVYAAGLAAPRSKGGWIFGIVLIAIGLSGCTMVASIPLLIFWINDRTKAWFGV
jgi:hypothetical protein